MKSVSKFLQHLADLYGQDGVVTLLMAYNGILGRILGQIQQNLNLSTLSVCQVFSVQHSRHPRSQHSWPERYFKDEFYQSEKSARILRFS
jgi:hypothetical protein